MAKTNPEKALRRFHAQGKRAKSIGDRRREREQAVWHTLEMLGAETASEKNRLMEARRFAALYDDEQLDWLCSLGQDEGKPLTRFHIVHLLRVADGRTWRRLAIRCAKQSWSERRLKLEVRQIAPRHAYGGRKHEPPQSLSEALLVTERMAASWLRWIEVLTAENEVGKRRITMNKLPKGIREKLVALSKEAEELSAKTQRWLDKKPRPRKKPPAKPS